MKQESVILDNKIFDGYLSEEGEGVIISHISSTNKGRGDFSKLLKELKENYKWIKIPTPSKQTFEIVSKKGFIHRKEFFSEPFNCIGDIMYWKKNNDSL